MIRVDTGLDQTTIFVSDDGSEYVISYSIRSPYCALHSQRVSLCAEPFIPDSRRPHIPGPHLKVQSLRVIDPGEGFGLLEIGEPDVFNGRFVRVTEAVPPNTLCFAGSTGTSYRVANPHHWPRREPMDEKTVSVNGYPVRFRGPSSASPEETQSESAPFLWLECYAAPLKGFNEA